MLTSRVQALPRARTGYLGIVILLFAATTFWSSFAAAQSPTFDRPPAPGTNYGSVQHGGYERRFMLGIPGTPSRKRLVERPVLVAFHGTGGTIEEYTDEVFATLTQYALAEGWFVLLPQALPEDPIAMTGKIRWNTLYPDPFAEDPAAPDDLSFVRTLLAAVDARFPIDSSRVFVAGFSGGGTMAQLLAATSPEFVTAVAASGSSRGTYSRRLLEDNTLDEVTIVLPKALDAVPALILHGSKEEELEAKRPYAGGLSDGSTEFAATQISPVWDQVDFWMDANRCRPVAQVEYGPGFDGLVEEQWDEERYRAEYYGVCQGRSEVIFITAIGMKHRWPSLANWGYDGDRYIVDFFRRH